MKFFFVKMKQKCKKYAKYLVISKKCCTFAQFLHKDIFEGVNFFSIFYFFSQFYSKGYFFFIMLHIYIGGLIFLFFDVLVIFCSLNRERVVYVDIDFL